MYGHFAHVTKINMRYTWLLFLLCSCVSPQYRPLPPVDAAIPEMPFSYMSNGSWREAFGQGSAKFSVGDTKKFKISLFSKGGACILRVLNGDTDRALSCTGKKELELDLGTYQAGEPEIISFVTTYEKLGTQVGYFYPSLAKERPVLDVSFKCPYQSQNGGFSVCTRPATYRFLYHLSFKEAVLGKFIHRRQCAGQPLEETVFDASGPFEKEFEITSAVPTYCVIGIGEKNTGKAHVIHVRFYDPKYIPLLPPLIKGSLGAHKVCAADTYDALSVNNTYEYELKLGGCAPPTFASPLLVFAWDRFGRFSFLEFSDLYFYNGWGFYEEAKKYAFEQVTATCGNVPKEECVRKNSKKLMYTDKVIKAVEKWDASILYQM